MEPALFWEALVHSLDQFPEGQLHLEAASSWEESGAFLTITLVAGAAFDSCRIQLTLIAGASTEVSVLETSSGSGDAIPDFVLHALAVSRTAADNTVPGPGALRSVILRLCDELSVELDRDQASQLATLGTSCSEVAANLSAVCDEGAPLNSSTVSPPKLGREVSLASSAALSFETQDSDQDEDDDIAADDAMREATATHIVKGHVGNVSVSDCTGPKVEDVIVWDTIVANLKRFPGDQVNLLSAGSWDGVEGLVEVCLSPTESEAEWDRLRVMVIAGARRTSVQLKGAQVVPDAVRAAVETIDCEVVSLTVGPSSVRVALQALCDALEIKLADAERTALKFLDSRERFVTSSAKPPDVYSGDWESSLGREAAAVNALSKQLDFIAFQIEHIKDRKGGACLPHLEHELKKLQRTHAIVMNERDAASAGMSAALRECTQTTGDTLAPIDISLHITDEASQSLRGHGFEHARELIMSTLRRSGPWAHYAAHQFSLMLMREQELHDEFICFYHSYSMASLIYEVHSEIARYAYDLPGGLAPIPRISAAGKNICRTLQDLKRLGGQDGKPEFQALGLSVSCSIFASGSEAPPLNCFMQGYSAGACSWRNLLKGVLELVGGTDATVEAVVDAAARSGLSVNSYGTASALRSASGLTGYMLQIFVHRSIVEQYAYPSEPYGRPIAGTMVDYVERRRTADGQARILFDPSVFLDSSKVKLFHYCARPLQSCMAAEVPQSRGAFLQELHGILSPLMEAQSKAGVAARLRGQKAQAAAPIVQEKPLKAAAPIVQEKPLKAPLASKKWSEAANRSKERDQKGKVTGSIDFPTLIMASKIEKGTKSNKTKVRKSK